jgi:hypothetical protein
MRNAALMAIALALLAACEPASSSSPSTQASPRAALFPTARPLAAGSAFGVFVEGNLTTYSVLIVGVDGKVAAEAQAAMPAVYRYTHFPPAPPVASLTGSRVYFADGGSIKYLKPDGSTGVAMPYPGGTQTAAGFAVSPDDRRVAVALLRFQSPDSSTASLDLYVQDLGGGNRVELFSSNTVAEWPIGWVNRSLIIAVGPAVAANASTNPYNAFQGYHIADASTGNRLVTMSNECLYGPLQPTGTACTSSGQVEAQAFDGSVRPFYPANGPQPALALSPSGLVIVGRPGADGAPIVVYNAPTVDARPLSFTGIPMGWIDEWHAVFYRPSGFSRGIIDFSAGSVPAVIGLPTCTCGSSGTFLGALTA